MNTEQAIVRLTEVIRRKHLALNPEQSYRAWLKRYCDHAKQLPAHLPSEQKVEQFLTALAKLVSPPAPKIKPKSARKNLKRWFGLGLERSRLGGHLRQNI